MSSIGVVRFLEDIDTAPGADVDVVAAFIDTELEEGGRAARRILGEATDETLAKYSSRYVLIAYWPADKGCWVRACPNEELLIREAVKTARDAYITTPGPIEFRLFLRPELREELRQAVLAEEARQRGGAN